MTFIEPDAEQIRALAESEDTGPVTMLNLLRFRPDGGEESYRRYGEGVLPILSEIGARLLWQGRADSIVIGDDERDGWDSVVLVQYPSRGVFLQMVSSPAYLAIAHHRSEALADSRLIACNEQYRGA